MEKRQDLCVGDLMCWDWMSFFKFISWNLEKNEIYSSIFLFYLYNIVGKMGLKKKKR